MLTIKFTAIKNFQTHSYKESDLLKSIAIHRSDDYRSSFNAIVSNNIFYYVLFIEIKAKLKCSNCAVLFFLINVTPEKLIYFPFKKIFYIL